MATTRPASDEQQGLAIFDPGFKAHAFPTYARLRTGGPVHHVTLPNGLAMWLVVGYDEAVEVLKDHHRFAVDPRSVLSEAELAGMMRAAAGDLSREELERVDREFGRHMLSLDPPDHSRLRRLVSRSFTPRFVEGLRPRVQEIADALLDDIEARAAADGRREMELLDDFAFPLPITVIAEMLGVPTADRHAFRDWSNAIVSSNPAQGVSRDVADKMFAFSDYLRAMSEEKRRHPTDDLVGDLVRARKEGDALDDDELISMLFLLIVAGHETTVNLIGNGMLALFEHPDQFARLKADPDLIKPAIEEMLRYYGPVELAGAVRFVREDLELGGRRIARGESVMPILAAANHDLALVADPDRLDLSRPPTRHVAFGTGIHACLGAPLARLEGEVAFATLLRRLPGLRLAVPRDALELRPGALLRGLVRLPVAF